MNNKKITLIKLLSDLKLGISHVVKYKDDIFIFDNFTESYKNENNYYLIDILSMQSDVDFVNSELEIVKGYFLNSDERMFLCRINKETNFKIKKIIVRRSEINYLEIFGENELLLIVEINKDQFKKLKSDRIYELNLIL